ncbi:hypothetical protein H072_5494 [Dactylellina haptotyla CBS 200.50]|uniref:Sfi1 spindle body domain-containing protein n=1 Tax=Dactylellina haptotyla (strain CBS 200.50) TaxID=1284197 RepID=S8AHH7_DACHA|nr:hypothetical protein H072_5494 [Dactylellina haptotyla CBS 200.50]
MPLDRQNHIFGVKKPLPTRVDLSRQEINLLREIVTYASVIPETTPWNALFHAYDAVLRKKGIDAALDDRCFRFLMRLAEVQGTSWYDRYATLLSMWQYEVPPKSAPSPMNDPISFSTGRISANIGPITITFKGTRKPDGSIGVASNSAPNPRITSLDDEYRAAPKLITSGKENLRVNNGRSSPHPSVLQRKKLPPSDEENRKRQELERMKAEFAFPTTLFETASEAGLLPPGDVETGLTRASFLNEQDFEDQNDEDNSPEHTVYIPPIRDKAGLVAAAEKAVIWYNNRQLAFAVDVLKHWRIHTYRAADYHQLQWDLACSKDQRILGSQVIDIWRTGVYWKSLERRVALQRKRAVLLQCIDTWRTKAVAKAHVKEKINSNMLMRKVFRAWQTQSKRATEKVRRFRLACGFRKWRQKLMRSRALEEVAQRRYERDLKYRAYWTLFYGYCNIRAPQLNELRIKKFALHLLQCNIARRKENERIADDLCCFSLLKKYFRVWRSDLIWTQEMSAKADEERRYMSTYKNILTWRREARFSPLIRQQQETHGVNQATALLALWRNRLRQINAADHVNKINVLKTTFRSWRLHLRTKQHEKYVKSMYLSTWFDKYSAALADRCYQYHVWKQRLGEWGRRLQFARDSEVAAADFADATVHITSKSAALQALRLKLSRAKELEDIADNFRRRKLLTSIVERIVHKREQLQQMYTWSYSAACFFGTKKFWKVWSQVMEKRKRQHRKEAYNKIAKSRALRIKTQAFNALLAEHDSIMAMNVTAYDFFDSGCKVHASNLLATWRGQLRIFQNLESDAIQYRKTRLAVYGIDSLTRKIRTTLDLYHLSETYNEISQKDKLAGVFKKIKNAHFLRKLDSVKADMFRERAEANRRKSTFRAWYWAYRERVERRQVGDQLNREFVLEEERQFGAYREDEAVGDQLNREFHLHARSGSRGRSDIGDTSTPGPEGLSIWDVSEWINSNSASAPLALSAGVPRGPQTPSARAARARALIETRNTTAQITRLKFASTTPTTSPAQRFHRSITQFRRGATTRPDFRFTQSLSSRLRQEIKEVDEEEEPSMAFLKNIGWGENEQLPHTDETEDEQQKLSGSTTAVATYESPER